MKIHSVEFKGSAVEESRYPKDQLPEILLSGRSNVGKSSFINSLKLLFKGRKKSTPNQKYKNKDA